MASVVINTRFNNRKAEADLKELQAKAKETAREINAVEKGLGSATTKRNKLRDDLEAARQKAAETAAALDEVNARLDAGRKSKFGVTSKGDETLSDKLAAKLQQQDTAVQAAADAYHAQDAAVQALQQRHAELTAQLAQEKDEATRQAEAVANAAQAAQAAQVDVSNVQRAANAMDAFVSKLFNAASVSKILKRSLSAIGSIGGKAFDFVKSKAQSVQERLARAAQSTEHFPQAAGRAGVRRVGVQCAFLRAPDADELDGDGAAVFVQPADGARQLAGRSGHGSRAHHSDTYPRADCAGKCGGDGVQLHCAAGGVLYRAHNLRQRRSSQGYERRRIGGGQRSEEGQGR